MTDFNYSFWFAFGAYLMRNFGGVELLSKMTFNDVVNIESITLALNDLYPGLTYAQVFARFGEAIVFNRREQDSVVTFDRAIDETFNGIRYTAPAIDIWNYWGNTGPDILDLTQRDMRPYSISVHSDDAWKSKSGSFSITLNKPDDQNVMLFLMAK